MASMVISVRRKSEDYNDDTARILGAAFVFHAGTYVSKDIVTALGAPQLSLFASFLFYLAWALVFGMFVMKNYSVLPKIIIAELVYWGIMLLSLKLYPNNMAVYENYFMFLRRISLVFLPCGIICWGCTQFEGIFEHLKPFALIGSTIILLAVAVGAGEVLSYQELGTYIAPFLLILFVNVLRHKTVLSKIYLIVDIVLCLAGGRQSIVIAILGCVLIYLFENRKKPKKVVLALISGMTILLLVFFLLGTMLNAVVTVVQSFGLNSRTLLMIADGDFFSTSTRDVIYESSRFIIERDGAQLSGLFGSVYKIRQMYPWIAYPHNIIYDFLIDFGTVLGGVFLLILTYKLLCQIFTGEPERRLLIVFLADVAIVRLMVSSNYLIEGSFYILLLMLMKGKPIRLRK